MATTKYRCGNQAEGCWHTFSLNEPHIRIGDKVFCGNECALQWAEINRAFQDAANPHMARIHTQPRRFNGG